MAYAQKNYNEIQGRTANGKAPKYRIAEIGCLVVSGCHVLEAFGTRVDPLQMNAFYRDRKLYIDVDDGIFDDLNWSSVCAYDGKLEMSRLNLDAKGSWPSHDNSIVKFKYVSRRTHKLTTHFCKVADAKAQTILDSWDGVVRRAADAGYGQPVAWAEFVYTRPEAVAPVHPPAPKPAPVPQPDTVNIKVESGWGATHVLKAAGYTKEQFLRETEWDRLAALNGSATRLKLHPGQIVKVYRNPLPVDVPTPTPAPVVPAAPTPEPAPAQAPAVDVSVETPAAPESTPDVDWRETYEEARGSYVCTETTEVADLEAKEPLRKIAEGQHAHVAGAFKKDGVIYYRPAASADAGRWYGLPSKHMRMVKGNTPKMIEAEDDELFHDLMSDDQDISLADELREMRDNLTARERVVAIVAKCYGLFTSLFRAVTFKGRK